MKTMAVAKQEERPFRPQVLLQRMTRSSRRSMANQAQVANRLPFRRLEALFRQEPLLKRGITKHAGDLVKTGFSVVEPGTIEDHGVNDDVQSWWRRHDADAAFRDALISAHVYGDGLLEFEWSDGGASTDEVPDNAELVDIHPVDPVDVTFEPFVDSDGVRRHWLMQRVDLVNPVRLHPDRYSHIRLTSLIGYKHGFSTVENAWHSALSKVKGDQALGETLRFSAQPKVWGKVTEGSDDEIEAVTDMVNSEDFVRGFVWNERLHLEQLAPPVIFDPTKFYKVLAESIATAIGLPMPMLVGAQAGAVVGSMTNLEDYHSDLKQFQENVLTSPTARIVQGITGLKSEDFDIYWPPFDTLRSEEATSIRDRVVAFNTLVASRIDPMAAARICGLELNEEDVLQPAKGQLPPGGGEEEEGEDGQP